MCTLRCCRCAAISIVIAMLLVGIALAANAQSDLAASAPTAKPALVTNDGELVAMLSADLQKVVDKDEFSVVVLVAHDGKPIYRKAFGLASKTYQVPNREDTQFNLASVGKMFTAVAILQLAQEGKLSLDDPAGKYIPEEWLSPELGSKIKIKHLLTHTSGFSTYFQALNKQSDIIFFRDLADYKKVIRSETPASEPGAKWNYSNTGMVLLGIIVEKVSEQEYFDYLNKHIFEPAGMTHTAPIEKDSAVPGRSTGYAKLIIAGKPVWRENNVSRVLKGNPSGGIYSNVDDLLQFDQALRSYKLLSPTFTQLALTPKPDLNSPFYGYGFFTSTEDVGRIAGHGGDGMGINCQFKMYLDRGYTVAVLSNYSAPSANNVDQMIRTLINRTSH